jgi:uncharacterized membrane protein
MVEHLRSSLWFLPAVFAAGAFVLAGLTLAIDRQLGLERLGSLHFGGSAEGARSVLATIAQSMLTFTALVFTITMLVLQLASSQLSPRVMRTFLRDRGNQTVLGLFVATFLYTLVVLRDVRSADTGIEFVPGFSIFVAFLLLLACVVAFVYYINHMAHAIRPTSVIESIATETRQAIDRLFPQVVGDGPEVAVPWRAADAAASDVVVAPAAGTLVTIDEDSLVEVLRRSDTVAALVPMVGDFLPEGAPLFRISRPDDRLAERLQGLVTLAPERALQQEAAFGFRQIVDVAVRALSPGTNDPTTAVQAIDRLHDLLRRLVERPLRPLIRTDDGGQPRLIVPRPDWSDYVHLAVDEIRISGRAQVQVISRLRAMLEDLAAIAPADRQPVIRQELSEVDRVAAAFESEHDQWRARRSR